MELADSGCYVRRSRASPESRASPHFPHSGTASRGQAVAAQNVAQSLVHCKSAGGPAQIQKALSLKTRYRGLLGPNVGLGIGSTVRSCRGVTPRSACESPRSDAFVATRREPRLVLSRRRSRVRVPSL